MSISNQIELWTESQSQNHLQLLGSIVRDELEKETLLRLDVSYLGDRINRWWLDRKDSPITECTHSSMVMLIKETMQPSHLEILKTIGSQKTRIAALLLKHAFTFINKDLAQLVHEAISEIAGIVDIKYPYEEHKELSPQINLPMTSDWGRGLGIIRPHSDDLYEEQSITMMCLTVCKDTSRTATWFWMLKDITRCLTDEELGYFALSEATFLSGKNVEGKRIKVTKNILRRDSEEGMGLRLDFRICETVGPRMKCCDKKAQLILNKMRLSLPHLKPHTTVPTEGSISVISNYKVLHGRPALNPVMLYDGTASRIIFRSKGTK